MYAEYSKIVRFEELPDPRDQWDLVEKIGEGTYGEVHLATHKSTGQQVAVKIMESIQEVVEEIEEEYQVLRDLSTHPNMPGFHGLFLKQDPQSEDQLWIALELCRGGSVTDLVKAQLANDRKLNEKLIAHILKETLQALDYLHKNNVMHRDVKGHNILLTADAQIKLVDFGVSAHLKDSAGRRNTSVGTPFWMAPEVIACEQQMEYDYDVRCDVWSLGVTAIELGDGEPPLADLHPMRALFKIPRSPPPELRNPAEWSSHLRDFIGQCVIKDFEQRPFVPALLKLPFIDQVPEDTAQCKQTLLDMMRDMGKVMHEPYVTTKHGQLRSKRKTNREPISNVDDLATLENLEEDVIVEHLRQRYDKGVIYTYIGDILLAVNPFRNLNIYGTKHSKLYRNAVKADNPPHIFAIADASFQAMMHNKHNQCIVISGESGAGKTESANLLVQQLTLQGRAPNRTLEDRILQVNPLVEAFGNAATVINGNSSRFGKYLEMTFTSNGKVTGAKLSEYLLEKSRVIHQSDGERNFHIFYYVHQGLTQANTKGKFLLREDEKYRYLNNGPTDSASLASNRSKFDAINKCFETIGFKAQEISAIYSILAAILHLGNIDFKEVESHHQTISSVKNSDMISQVSDLLGIDGKEMNEALTTSGMVARGETIIKHYTVAESVNVRDAMAKAMYGRLFSWIVNKINLLLKPGKAKGDESFSIGILDIFGFENFKTNSFEQLCINIANEQIQYYFNQHIFAWEQQEYKNEGIAASDIVYVDNRPVLDMFLTKPVGILALLDEESNFPKATDATFVAKLKQNIKNHQFSTPKSETLAFSVQHYAGTVNYAAVDFLEKNRDRLVNETVAILRSSQIALVRTLFNSPITKTGNLAYNTMGSSTSSLVGSPTSSMGSSLSIRSASNTTGTTSQSRTQQTVATYFRYSLMDLLSKMVAGTPHFVRCLRPNTENTPGYFDKEKVLVQLRYTGVLETTRIRRQGYSHRIPFSEFLKRYYILGFDFNERVRVNRESCQVLLNKIGLTNWELGKTKVFLKYYHIEQLSRKFEEQHRKIVVTQAMVRMWIIRNRFRKMRAQKRASATTIQSVYRGWMIRRKYKYLIKDRNKAATTIQSGVRGFLARREVRPELKRRHTAVILLQAYIRGFVERRRQCSPKESKWQSAIKIQSGYRGFKNLQKLKDADQKEEHINAAIILQKYFRMWAAKAQYVRKQLHRSKEATERICFSHQVEDASRELSARLDLTNYSNSTTPTSDSSRVSISDERREHLLKAGEKKVPWNQSDISYYNSANEDSQGKIGSIWARQKEKIKQLTSTEGRSYYDSIVTEMNQKFGVKKKGGRSKSLSASAPQLSRPVSSLVSELEKNRKLGRRKQYGLPAKSPRRPSSSNYSKPPPIPMPVTPTRLSPPFPGVVPPPPPPPPAPHHHTLPPPPAFTSNPDTADSRLIAKRRWEDICKKADSGNASQTDDYVNVEKGGGDQNMQSPHQRQDLQRHIAQIEDIFQKVLTDNHFATKIMHDLASPASMSSLTKSDSLHSLAWDNALEQARERVLAPDSVPWVPHIISPTYPVLRTRFDSLEVASDAGTGTPSILELEEANDILISNQDQEFHDSDSATDSYYLSSNDSYWSNSLNRDYDPEYDYADSMMYETPGSWSYESFTKAPLGNYAKLPWGSPQVGRPRKTGPPGHKPPGAGGDLYPVFRCNCEACRYTTYVHAVISQGAQNPGDPAPLQYKTPRGNRLSSYKSPNYEHVPRLPPPRTRKAYAAPKPEASPSVMENKGIPVMNQESLYYCQIYELLQSKTAWSYGTMTSDSGLGETYFPSYDIPEPPSEPPPEPPTGAPLKSSLSYDSLKSQASYSRGQKKVRFSNTDDIYIRSPTPGSEVSYDTTEDSQEIRMFNDIDSDEIVYKEELILEQQELRNELMRNLEVQSKNSLSARFHRRQNTAHAQEEMERRWKNLHESKEAEDDGAYRRILSRGSSKSNLGPSPTPYHMGIPPGLLNMSQDQRAGEAADDIGAFNYRSLLRKTNFDPQSGTLRKVMADDPEVSHLKDYRSVLKKKSVEQEPGRLGRHIITT